MSLFQDIFTLAWPAATCGAAVTGLLAHATFAPASTFWGPVISRAPDADGAGVALTFDDGPTPGSTDRILDTLGELRVRAAFYVIGRSARRWPGLVERMHAEGHLVGNHTLDHSHFGLFRRDGYWNSQVAEADEAIREIIGVRPATFRPPMGIKTAHVAGAARSAGHKVITWTRRAFDGLGTSAGRIVARLGPRAESGDILMLHDGVDPNTRRDPAPTVQSIRPLVEQLRARGLEPRPLDEMLGISAYQAD
jgi:peptidoglycan/xylan/chitin deacetylase (PgdA/CDA1 family)